jgi:hypothetical protein
MNPGRFTSGAELGKHGDSAATKNDDGWFWLAIGILLSPLYVIYFFVRWSLQSWVHLLIGSSISAIVFFIAAYATEAL